MPRSQMSTELKFDISTTYIHDTTTIRSHHPAATMCPTLSGHACKSLLCRTRIIATVQLDSCSDTSYKHLLTTRWQRCNVTRVVLSEHRMSGPLSACSDLKTLWTYNILMQCQQTSLVNYIRQLTTGCSLVINRNCRGCRTAHRLCPTMRVQAYMQLHCI